MTSQVLLMTLSLLTCMTQVTGCGKVVSTLAKALGGTAGKAIPYTVQRTGRTLDSGRDEHDDARAWAWNQLLAVFDFLRLD